MDLELIEDYILNRLSAEEEETVRKRIETDEEFATSYNSMKVLAQTIQRSNTRDTIEAIHTQKLQEWENEKVLILTPQKNRFNFFLKFGGVALAACLIAVLYLSNANFKLPKASTALERGEAKSSENLVNEEYILAQDKLRNGEYKEAAARFKILKTHPELRDYYQDEARWYEIVAASEFDKDKAKELLTILENEKETAYQVSFVEKLKMKIRLLF